jgi:hypothetical protein
VFCAIIGLRIAWAVLDRNYIMTKIGREKNLIVVAADVSRTRVYHGLNVICEVVRVRSVGL